MGLHGDARWGYRRPSLVETKLRCFKPLGVRAMARDFDRQVAELQIRAVILNGFTALGTPQTQCLKGVPSNGRKNSDLAEFVRQSLAERKGHLRNQTPQPYCDPRPQSDPRGHEAGVVSSLDGKDMMQGLIFKGLR